MGFANPNNSSEILYGSSGDVRNEINSYASPAGSGHYVDETEVPASSIIRSLERATRRINAYLQVVYSTKIPVTVAADVPVLLDDIGSDLATYFVWRENMFRLAKMPEEKRQSYYLDHMSVDPPGTLTLLRSRELQLPEFESAYTDETKSVRSQGQAPIFDLDDEKNWEVDPKTLDDIDAERNS